MLSIPKTCDAPEIMQLSRFCPWQDHLFDLEEEEEAPGTAFQDSGFLSPT